MKNLLSVVVLSLLPLSSMAATILVLGDSISAAYGIPQEAGWVALMEQRLENRYPRRFEVVNASISGDTTAGGLYRLPPLLRQHDPALVIVELGGNDGLRGMSLKQMEANLRQIVDKSLEHGSEVALVSVDLPVSYGVHFNRMFRQVFVDVAEAAPVAHVALGFADIKDRELLQEDGIHPTAQAQPIVLDLIWATIGPVIKKMAPSPE